jgi:NitT/TauT family transport system substrate-binding protein
VASGRTSGGSTGTALAGLALALLLAAPGWAQQPTRIRLTLEFRFYAGTAPTIFAEAGGFFRDEAIEAKIDSGSGSGEAITRVASGAYDFGIADIGALVEFATRNPDTAPKAVMILYDRSPHAIVSLKRAGIARPADLAGRRLLTGQSDATMRLFPSFARLNQLDLATVTRMPVDVRLREPMLLRGEADATMGFDYTIIFNLLNQNVPRDAMALIDFADYGFDFYGNSLIAARATIERQPDLVRRVARAVARGWVATARDPKAAIAAVAKLDPLTPLDLELARLTYVLEHHVVTAATRAGGLGAVDDAKLGRTIRTIAEGFELPRVPAPAEIYHPGLLPPAADRRL